MQEVEESEDEHVPCYDVDTDPQAMSDDENMAAQACDTPAEQQADEMTDPWGIPGQY